MTMGSLKAAVGAVGGQGLNGALTVLLTEASLVFIKFNTCVVVLKVVAGVSW